MSVTKVNVEITVPENEDGGFMLEGLVVREIRTGGPADGKLKINDVINSVNGEPCNGDNVCELLGKSEANMKLEVTREAEGEPGAIPADREKFINRREGFNYMLVEFSYKKGVKFGLGIKHFQNRVLVSKVDDGSLVSDQLIVTDRIVDVNGTPVSDKDICRAMLIKSLQQTRKVNMIVERAVTADAKTAVNNALNASQMMPPSVMMASDIREIVQRQQEKMKTPMEAKKGILRKSNRDASPNRVQINDKAIVQHVIASDNEGKELKKVQK